MAVVCDRPPGRRRAVTAAPLDRAPAATRVADLLRERIASGQAAPGSRIVELEVARALGTSRSPVREALLRLCEEGLVAIVPYRGAIVVPLQRQRFVELTEVRLAIEHFALDRLIDRNDKNILACLQDHAGAIRRAARGGDLRAIADEDLAAHRTLVGSAGNTLLERTYHGLLAQIRLYIGVTSARYDRAEELADEHDALLAAVRRRDAMRARALLDRHVLHGFDEGAAPAERESEPETSPGPTGRKPRRMLHR